MKIFLTSAATLTMAVLAGCHDSPVDPPVHNNGNDSNKTNAGANVLINGTFATSLASVEDVNNSNCQPWLPGTGTPQIGAGFGADSTHGYIAMWGNRDEGECLMQILPAPIKKGKTYILTASVRFWNDNPANYNPFTRVRFMAFNTAPSTYGRWAENRPGVAVIGNVQTSNESWAQYTLPEWTADADYAGFAFNVEDDIIGDGSACWAKIDNIVLREKAQ